jgi:hypothetical protein
MSFQGEIADHGGGHIVLAPNRTSHRERNSDIKMIEPSSQKFVAHEFDCFSIDKAA